jgi:hypothetical protein
VTEDRHSFHRFRHSICSIQSPHPTIALGAFSTVEVNIQFVSSHNTLRGPVSAVFVVVALGIGAFVAISSTYLAPPIHPNSTGQTTTSGETCTPAITLTQPSANTATTQVITLCHTESTYTASNTPTATCVQTLSAPLYLIVKNDNGTPIPDQTLSIQAHLLEGFAYNSTTDKCDAVSSSHSWTNHTRADGKIELGMTGDVFNITTTYLGKTYQVNADAEGAESAECVTLSLPSGAVNTTYAGFQKYQC